ncbi:MAG: FAD-dependent oxidoreductase [Thermodesulfovibrionales bacterium]|nr:FAD-dependent oxidoreductase [Thermodesulfovibrionales bacterium]
MAKIVILGGSFGGLTAAFELKRLLGKAGDITLLSDMGKFVFIPSLPWLAMGWRKPEDITLPLRPILERRGIKFIHAEAKGVDADSAKVVTALGEIPYDYLVIATGPSLAFEEVPGLGPDKGHTECIFTLEQAERTNKAWNRFLEEPGPIVTGSVQGVSCFGPPYEYAFEMDYELRRMKIRHKAPIVFVTPEPYIGHFGIGGLGNSKRIMEDEFAKRDIKVITNAAVEEFVPAEVRLKDGSKIPHKLAMFAPAMKGVPAVAHLGNPRGFIPVDGKCRHTKHKNIFAAGVAVAIAPPEQTPVPTGVPKTGFMTVKMAKTTAYSIAAEIAGSAAPASYEMDVLCLMDMGDTAALMRAKPLLPPRQESELKSGVIYKWSKVLFEKYFLWKIKHGLSNLP